MEESCAECNEVHEPLEHHLKRMKRGSWLYGSGYFISLAVLAYVSYVFLDVFGLIGFLALYGVYFCQLNMRAIFNQIDLINMSIQKRNNHAKTNTSYNEGGTDEHGQYL